MDKEIIAVDAHKYIEALNNILGQDNAYFTGDKDVDAIVEIISLAKRMEDIIRRQQDEIEEQDKVIINALKYMSEIRAKAIKDFMQALTDKYAYPLYPWTWVVDTDDIESLAKEWVGEHE